MSCTLVINLYLRKLYPLLLNNFNGKTCRKKAIFTQIRLKFITKTACLREDLHQSINQDYAMKVYSTMKMNRFIKVQKQEIKIK